MLKIAEEIVLSIPEDKIKLMWFLTKVAKATLYLRNNKIPKDSDLKVLCQFFDIPYTPETSFKLKSLYNEYLLKKSEYIKEPIKGMMKQAQIPFIGDIPRQVTTLLLLLIFGVPILTSAVISAATGYSFGRFAKGPDDKLPGFIRNSLMAEQFAAAKELLKREREIQKQQKQLSNHSKNKKIEEETESQDVWADFL